MKDPSLRHALTSLIAAAILACGGAYWISLKLRLLSTLESTHVGADVVVMAYVVFALATLLAGVSVMFSRGRPWLHRIARAIGVANLCLLMLWTALHLSGKIVPYEAKPQPQSNTSLQFDGHAGC